MPRLVQPHDIGDLRLAGSERTADIMRARVEGCQVSIPALHQIVVLIDQLPVFFPEWLPCPLAAFVQHHAEGFLPALQRGVVVLGMFGEPADQIAGGVLFVAQFGDQAVAEAKLVAKPADVVAGIVVVGLGHRKSLPVAVSKLSHFRHGENLGFYRVARMSGGAETALESRVPYISPDFCYHPRMTNPTTKILLALLTFAMMTGVASAQQRTIYDSRGNVVGRSATDISGTVTNYDARGKVISRESTSGNQTTIYDASGRNVGRVTTSR